MKKEHNNLFKKNVEYYRENYYTDDYNEYLKTQQAQRKKNHDEYISREKTEWKDRTDYFDEAPDICITQVHFLDVLSNDGISKVLSKIYKLPKRSYRVRNYYKKPSLFRKYDYVHYSYGGYGYGSFAEILFLKSEYISRIDISITQLNSYYAVLEYIVEFKNCLTQNLYDKFIFDQIKNVKPKRDYTIAFNFSDRIEDNYNAICDVKYDYFIIICQHYITSLLFSEQGNENELVNLTVYTRKKPINIDALYLGDMNLSFYNKKEGFVVITEFDRVKNYLYAGNRRIPSFCFSHYIGEYGNALYNQFFWERELSIFQNTFSKYVSGRKKPKYNKDYYELLRKTQSFCDIEYKNINSFYDKFSERWDFYYCNDKRDIKEYFSKTNINLSEIYKNTYEYLRLRVDISIASFNHVIAIVALLISILAFLKSLL